MCSGLSGGEAERRDVNRLWFPSLIQKVWRHLVQTAALDGLHRGGRRGLACRAKLGGSPWPASGGQASGREGGVVGVTEGKDCQQGNMLLLCCSPPFLDGFAFACDCHSVLRQLEMYMK